jgi:hypothetical protein
LFQHVHNRVPGPTEVEATISVHVVGVKLEIKLALMMGTETVPETLDFNELTRLSAREDFIYYVKYHIFSVFIMKDIIHFTINTMLSALR